MRIGQHFIYQSIDIYGTMNDYNVWTKRENYNFR